MWMWRVFCHSQETCPQKTNSQLWHWNNKSILRVVGAAVKTIISFTRMVNQLISWSCQRNACLNQTRSCWAICTKGIISERLKYVASLIGFFFFFFFFFFFVVCVHGMICAGHKNYPDLSCVSVSISRKQWTCSPLILTNIEIHVFQVIAAVDEEEGNFKGFDGPRMVSSGFLLVGRPPAYFFRKLTTFSYFWKKSGLLFPVLVKIPTF